MCVCVKAFHLVVMSNGVCEGHPLPYVCADYISTLINTFYHGCLHKPTCQHQCIASLLTKPHQKDYQSVDKAIAEENFVCTCSLHVYIAALGKAW